MLKTTNECELCGAPTYGENYCTNHKTIEDRLMIVRFTGPFTPIQAKNGDAGFDIACNEDICLYAKNSKIVSTGLHVEIPPGFFGRVLSRSGLAFNKSIEVGAGVIDSGYRGEIKVKLYNFGNNAVRFMKGDRIAQLVIQKHESPVFVMAQTLSDSSRGLGGFGHTGLNQEVLHASE